MNNRGSGWGLRNLANRIRELLVLVSLIGTSGFCQPVVIATIGDYGSGSSYAGAVADLVKSWNPDFVLSLGDNNYGDTNYIDTAIGQFYHDFIYPYVGNYGAGASSNRFFPVLGNHDWGYPFPTFEFVQFYLDYFQLPGNERYFNYRYGRSRCLPSTAKAWSPTGSPVIQCRPSGCKLN